jgi:acyl transferase domain-containing protein/NAD(P)-dependent dehydrogenase (short-subunit alcohol dehydrogenase family)/SAM-dependent methyltransferase/acyl carrier protein
MASTPNPPELSPVKRALVEIAELRAKLQKIEGAASEPLAVIGMAVRLPGAPDVDAFWRMLREGRIGITDIPPDRWDADRYYSADLTAPGKMYVRRAGFLEQVDKFDAGFFAVQPREAITMDPQQRLMLEVAWEALEDAAQPPAAIAESASGVFLGMAGSDYFRLLLATAENIDMYTGSGGSPSIAAGRLSYHLGLHGPSLVVDTSCSSSLVATHLACRSLRSRECRMAVVGGINLMLTPENTVALCKARMLSPDGLCKAFDESADGFARAEGCGVIILKRFADALDDGDRIHAVIRGSAVNQDGRSGGLTVPSGPAQEAVIRLALADAHVDPADIGYVEAHGTGTALGDPIEFHALVSALCAGRGADRPLLVGSVKTNLGHLEAAAGITGLIKTILALEHGEIPPHLHLKKLNPHIDPGGAPVHIPTDLASWSASGVRRIAGVSSFGFSGTNAHVIVEQAPQIALLENDAPPHTLMLSARTPEALAEMARRYATCIDTHPHLAPADVCFTAATGRKQFAHRAAWSGSSLQELRQKLEAFAAVGACETWPEAAAIRPARRVSLPTYPFERRRYWIEQAVVQPWPGAIEAARTQSLRIAPELHPETYPAKWQALGSIATASIVQALADLGVPLRPEERYTADSLIKSGGILPNYERLIGRWLEHLTARGWLKSESDGTFVALDAPLGPGREEVLAGVSRQFQNESALIEYAAACGRQLPEILRGKLSPLETLFPNGDATLAQRLYEKAPVSTYFNSIAAAAAAALSRAHMRGCRILEVGAGTGATTASVLPRLDAHYAEYCFTDVSGLFLSRAKRKFSDYRSVNYRLLDIDRDPAQQGYELGGFDLVLATNVIHATADLPRTLAHVRSLLAPGGALILCEATEYLPWFDITTALIEGWQRYNDGIRRDHPLLSASQWTSVLRDAGFIDVRAFPEDGEPTQVLGQHVLLALAPATVAVAVSHTDAGGGFSEKLLAAAPADRRPLLQDLVRERLAAVLGVDHPGALAPTLRLMDLGLDSLMALELRESLERVLQLRERLRSTLVFDFPTIDAVVEHLHSEIFGGESEPAPPTRANFGTGAEKDAVAIIGAGCRLPGGVDDLESFWRLLANGTDAVTEIPRDRWNIADWYDADPDTPGKMATRWGGFLDGVDRFDPEFFGISAREAESMDPQQRLLLEVSWEALENAAQNPARLSESRTGVFVGLTNDDYGRLLSRDDASSLDSYYASGVARSVAAGRISYVLGLQGPNISIDTACSSSLVAVHQACQSLRSGECRLALAGGANIILLPETTVALSRAHMMAPDGRCKSFDDSADGFVRAEGCVILVLKRLSDAIRDRDHVLALIRGSAVNQDGRSSGLTVPNGPAQEGVIRQALSDAGVDPSDVDYVEAHGTGTALGDPIEAHALAAVLGKNRDPRTPLRLGSVKTNLGHLEAAAGAAGLLKAALVLSRNAIPPSLHFHRWNHNIDWKGTPVSVPVEYTPWERIGRPRIAGVSSFGFSGTNAHVVLEEAPLQLESEPTTVVQVLRLSSRTESALRHLVERYCSFFDDHPDIALTDVCYTAATCRSVFPWQLEVRGETVAEIRRHLADAVKRADFNHAPALDREPSPATEEAPARQKVALPLTPFERQRYWRDRSRQSHGGHPLLGRRITSPALTQTVFEIAPRDWPEFLSEHRVRGKAVLPMAAYIEIFLAAADTPALEDLIVTEPLEFESAGTLQVVAGADRVELYRREHDRWALQASARPAKAAERLPAKPPAGLQAQAGDEIDPRQRYDLMRALGVELGPTFQLLRKLHGGAGQALGRIEIPPGADEYRAHPALIDAWIQVLSAALVDADALYLPLGIERFELFESPTGELWCWATLRRVSSDTLSGDIEVLDTSGRAVARIEGLTIRRASAKRSPNCLYKVEWRNKDLPAAGDRIPAASWLVIADAAGVGAALAAELRNVGVACRVVEAGHSFGDELHDPGLTGVIHLRALDAPSAEHLDINTLGHVEREIGESILMVVQSLAARKENAPQLVLVTRGAQAVADNQASPCQAPVWGLARTIRLEHPELRCLAVDLDPHGSDSADALWREIAVPDGETQVAWRANRRLAARLVPLNGDSVRLEPVKRGGLDHLQLRRPHRRRPGHGEVEIQVAAAALNFRDVLNALDMYPGDPGPLGAECAGHVVEVGEGVVEFARGDAVMALAKGCLGTHVTTAAALVALKPARLTMQQAAALPVAYVTARYALHQVAGIRTGQSVLIHAAAGGVGLAAVAEAQRAGAEIFATAGTEEKRVYLRSLGIRHVMSSRTTDYLREILDLTVGRGVDLVLNSLTGEFIAANLRLLAHGGCYLEIGKNGIWEPAAVTKERPDVRYSIIDWGQEYESSPDGITALFQQVVRAADSGEMAPLPCRDFKLSDASSAFRWMAQARHIGKIVITSTAVRADGAYLITGGLGGLGLRLAERLVERGARTLCLVGRRAPQPEALLAIRRMEERGARITSYQADVSRKQDLKRIFDDLSRNGTLLKGVVHSAGVFENAVLRQTDADSFARVLAPKVEGAWALHELTAAMNLDFFVMFSSIASVLGAPGQASYAAANSFLDALAHFRRSRGLPAVSINWGAWSEVGTVAGERASAYLSELGAGFFSAQEGLDLFELSLAGDQAQFTAAFMNWDQARRTLRPHEAFLSEVAGVLPAPPGASVAAAELVEMLGRSVAGQRPTILLDEVRRRACIVMGLAPDHPIDPDRPLSDLGLDSLMAVELRNALSSAIGKPLPSTLIFSYPSTAAIADYLASQMDPEPQTEALESAAAEVGDFLSQLERLSEGEVEQLLNQAAEQTS